MEKEMRGKLEGFRDKLTKKINQWVNVIPNLLEPLKDLKENQMAAVVALGFLTRWFMVANAPAVKLGADIVARFKTEIDTVCPDFSKVLTRDPCFEAEIEYATAMSKCKEEGRDEDECHEAWGPGARAVQCTMEELEILGQKIKDIYRRLTPPRPIPWPE